MGTSAEMAAVLQTLHPVTGAQGLIGTDPESCARVLGVDGVALSLLTSDGTAEMVWASEGDSRRLEDLQFTLGEGPCVDAVGRGSLVIEPDLSRLPADRWPVLLPELAALGIGAVFCFPLLVGRVCMGILTLQRRAAGPLTDAGMDDALILTGALTAVLLDGGAASDALMAVERPSDLYRAAVHQATGMISVQAGIPLSQALLRLRAYAYRHGRPILEVAEDVVARRLDFRNDGPEPDPSGRKRG
ncbi:GAF and ANTAR domain-containing protein [Streptomyces ochraceiscleroticus]|uniref:GAF and ANTAR domain-containing protein n=1 Tax=Streptomyces ochraceiscleroticus TaxID=47761 RepID=A0ABW1MCV0_9ACTN|nr:GAF and ANTAR domain-containing protein [Streptomyces ochraceiscleroticus]